MKVVRASAEMRSEEIEGAVAFVATLGALHEGHLSLLRAARDLADNVVMSIFVNPLQFGPTEDYASYPRDEDRDLELARAQGVDVVFLPSVEEMYPPGGTTTVDPGALSQHLEGAFRPGHFRGVATIVAKLFNIVGPDLALFGQKDAQQVAVIKQLVRDLAFDIEIVVCPTVRELDGLAMSSRNRYLDLDERANATALWRALNAGSEVLQRSWSPDDARRAMAQVFETSPGVAIEYAEAVDPDTFDAVKPDKDVLLVVAARVGPTRLIDNLLVSVQPRPDSNAGAGPEVR